MIRERTRRAVPWPCSSEKKPIGRSTLFRWLKDYREKGFPGLMPKVRKDKGVARTDRSEQVDYALGLLYEQPERSLTQLMVYLELEFGKLSISRSTLNRDLHAHPAFAGILQRRKGADKKLRDLYETDQPHECWQLDAKGPFPVTLIDGQTIRVHVLSVLDDFSRYILAAIIALAENIEGAVRVFRLAALKWGIALRMQFDRASAYDSQIFRNGLAFLGVHRNWVKSRNPAAQGKIEAYHRSLKRWFVKELPNQQVIDLEHLEALLQATIALVYNRHHHREIKMTPEQALARRISARRVGADQLARAFQIAARAKSHPKTGQVTLASGLFRVPARFAGKKCDFRCDPVNKDQAWLIIDDAHKIRLEPFTKKRPFDVQKTEQKRGTGQLQKLLDIWQGHRRPNAQPGFGLPEVFRQFSRLLQRPVPIDQHEAAAIASFYRKNGPLPAEPFRQAIDKTADALGPNRALRAYLQYIDRLVQAQKNKPDPSQDPL
jgi:transposase InsO family protein